MISTYSNFSFYQIQTEAISADGDFFQLSRIFDYLFKHRRTPYAIALRDQIELRLRELIEEAWDDASQLEEFSDYLEAINNRKLSELNMEIDDRIESLFEEENFDWPSTIAGFGNGAEEENYREPVSLLSLLGYRTGEKATRDGLNDLKRRSILKQAYKMRLSPSFCKRLGNVEWGEAGTGQRLRRIAYCSAESTKDMKRRRSGNYDSAIEQREGDLAWLKVSFYDGVYGFGFPDTKIY